MTKNPNAPSWPEAVEKFATFMVVKRRSALTVRNYTDDLAFFAKWYESQRQDAPALVRLIEADLSEWTQHMVGKLQMAPQTVNRKLSAMASFLKWAQAEKLAQPVGIPEKERPEKQPPKWLERNERNALYREVKDSGNQLHLDMITVLLNTGLRVSELAALKWPKITLSDRKGEMKVEGKGRKKRTIQLNPDARKALLSLGYQRYRGQDRHVIQSQNGPMTIRGIQYIVERYGPRAKIDTLTVHMLRHTFAHDLLAAGVPLNVVSELLGHESINTTALYVTPSEAERQAAVDRLSIESREPAAEASSPQPKRRGRRS
jgi:integrase/recombinase XerD